MDDTASQDELQLGAVALQETSSEIAPLNNAGAALDANVPTDVDSTSVPMNPQCVDLPELQDINGLVDGSDAAGEIQSGEAGKPEQYSTVASPVEGVHSIEETNLFAPEDNGLASEASLASDADLFGDDTSESAILSDQPSPTHARKVNTDSAFRAEVDAAEDASSSPSGGGLVADRDIWEDDIASGEKIPKRPQNDSLPMEEICIPKTWVPLFPPSATLWTWKVPPALSILTQVASSDALHQPQPAEGGIGNKNSSGETPPAKGNPAITSNCRLVQWNDNSFSLFVDNQYFECNIKEDPSFIFEKHGPTEPLGSSFGCCHRLQVLMHAGVGVDSFFSDYKQSERLTQKIQTALTTTELVEAADIAAKQDFVMRQEAARGRRIQADAYKERGLTRGFLEQDDSDSEDQQGESLEKIKERFKRRRFV